MQTNFTLAQLADPHFERSNEILRNCVHCGFCTATCPTYQTLGDERDSPRGRIYLIRDMLEADTAPAPAVVDHIDKCLSCLSCMTTCPSGVHYMHLVDHARAFIQEKHKRPLLDRAIRQMLGLILPHPRRMKLALTGAALARPFAGLFSGRLRAMLDLAPRTPPKSDILSPRIYPADGERKHRVALLAGCAQQVLDGDINAATIRLLNRLGVEVVVAEGAGCCGALEHHMGREDPALVAVRANVVAWNRERHGDGLDAIIINASGCGTTVKDYGHMMRNHPALADSAAWVSSVARDITEFLSEIGLPAETTAPDDLTIGYHSACSLRHGQKIIDPPKDLLKSAGFRVVEPAEAHLCCGSAGTYNIMQPDLANQLKQRKLDNFARTNADVIAAGNIGCMTQLGEAGGLSVVHTVELLDWATGGPKPDKLN